MTTFALILSVLTITGERFEAVIDYNLTVSDCTELRRQWDATLEGQTSAYVVCTASKES